MTEWPGRDVFSDGLPVMGCIRAGEIIPMELKSKIEMLINSDSSCKSKVYPALLFSFKMEVWSDEISDWDTTPADKCVSQPPFIS